MQLSLVFKISFISSSGTYKIEKEAYDISWKYLKTQSLSFSTTLNQYHFPPRENDIMKVPPFWAHVDGKRIPFTNLTVEIFGTNKPIYFINIYTIVRRKKERFVDGIGARSRIFINPNGANSRMVDVPCKNKAHKRRERIKHDLHWMFY